LEDDGLVVIDGYLGAIVREGYRIRRRGGIVRLWGRRRRSINAACGLVDINDIHYKRIYQDKLVIRV
jgi:hypothetical protein